MNVFILGTGRCGSLSVIAASKHIENYTAGHETRVREIASSRFSYPENHIEADNRLSWLLGELDKKYGNNAIYIHLKRDREKTALSFLRRYDYRRSMINAYAEGIKMSMPEHLNKQKRLEFCRDYVDTINSNIELFLKGKTKSMQMNLETIEDDFISFWELIGAEGNIEKALGEIRKKHNASKKNPLNIKYTFIYPIIRIWRKLTIRVN